MKNEMITKIFEGKQKAKIKNNRRWTTMKINKKKLEAAIAKSKKSIRQISRDSQVSCFTIREILKKNPDTIRHSTIGKLAEGLGVDVESLQ